MRVLQSFFEKGGIVNEKYYILNLKLGNLFIA